MDIEERKAIQTRITSKGFPCGDIDGFFGSKTNAALRAYLRSLMAQAPQRWPGSDQASLTAFYGRPGDESKLVPITFPYPMLYEGRLVKTTRCNRACADSLVRVLNKIGDRWSGKPGVMEEAQDYGGLFNDRNKRGGSTKSLHAYGAAIDLDADDNAFKDVWPLSADMPIEIIEAFSEEGWTSAAAFWGYDAMHFQATRS